MSLIVDINPVPWKILDLVRARMLKNRAKKAKKGVDWSKETLRREMSLQPGPLSRRRKDEPSFTPSGSVHYSITILDRNTEYRRGTVTGTYYGTVGGVERFIDVHFEWISKSQPVVTPIYRLPGLQATLGPDPGIPAFRVSLVDAAQLGVIDGWAGAFSFSGQGDPADGNGNLVLGNPVVTTTGIYSALLNRDWENWSNKITFKFDSQNELGEVENTGRKENKRFILLIPKIQGSAGIQVYPSQWPNLSGSSGDPVGIAITVARQEPTESTVAGPSDYYSLIESATGIPWSEVESVQIANGIQMNGGAAPAPNDLSTFKTKLTDQSIPFSSGFGNTYDGDKFSDQTSWVYPHSITT
jgi:hypothetical protein